MDARQGYVDTQIFGFFNKSFDNFTVQTGRKVNATPLLVTGSQRRRMEVKSRTLQVDAAAFSNDDLKLASSHVRIHDARRLQKQAPSVAAFFDRYGFALLHSRTAVQDWNTDPARPTHENDIARTYWREVEEMIRAQLLPDLSVVDVEQLPNVVRRGPGAVNPTGQTTLYGLSPHQDFGINADDFEDNTRSLPPPYGGEGLAHAWRERFDASDVHGMMVVCFWRPINMTESLKHTPLCVADPLSIDLEDMVRVGYAGPDGELTNLMMLRENANQRWYYYPEMQCDEVLVFKQFDYFKEDAGLPPTLRTCFHSAFRDPNTPKDCAQRQSCEHRVRVYFDKPRPTAARL